MSKNNLRRLRPPVGYLVVLLLAIVFSPTPSVADEDVTWETIEADTVKFVALQYEIGDFIDVVYDTLINKPLTSDQRVFFSATLNKYEANKENVVRLRKALVNSAGEKLLEGDLPHVWRMLKVINFAHKAFLQRYHGNLMRLLAALKLSNGPNAKMLEATERRITIVENQLEAWKNFDEACFYARKVKRYLAEAK